jgi:hypothetical protein
MNASATSQALNQTLPKVSACVSFSHFIFLILKWKQKKQLISL